MSKQVKYECTDGMLCITPCKFMPGEVKVGSGECMRCKRFLSKDRVNKIVNCKTKVILSRKKSVKQETGNKI